MCWLPGGRAGLLRAGGTAGVRQFGRRRIFTNFRAEMVFELPLRGYVFGG
jgi:hypothetical protein